MAHGMFLNLLLESSSSSDEDDEDDLLLECEISNSLFCKQKKAKLENYIDIINNYSEEEFRRNFRIHRTTYTFLTKDFYSSEFSPKGRHGTGDATAPNLCILCFLWFAGNKCVLRDVAGRFGIAESTCHAIIIRVMNFLNHVASKYITFPKTEAEKFQVAHEFENISGFPGVLGCIDGTYIPIRTPAHKIKSTYVNRHDYPSITLQGICNAKKLFLDVFTGPPSKIHDSRVFKLSFISSRLPKICHNSWHILGDSAYPIKSYLITPYRDYGNLTREEKKFNKSFSATRVKIENTFGLLKQRWRQLKQIEFLSIEKIVNFIIACCVLHNLCIMNSDEWQLDDENIYDDSNDYVYHEGSNLEEKRKGEEKRTTLCNLINSK